MLTLLILNMGCTAISPADKIDSKSYFEAGAELRIQSKGKAPEIGLALAGGGTKAGSFAVGVLHGLTEAGVMERVDAISTVSGGGYAALWYFARIVNGAEHAEGSSLPLRQAEIAQTYFVDCLPYKYNRFSVIRYVTDAPAPYSDLCPQMNYTNFCPSCPGFSYDEVRYQNYLRGYQDVMAWIKPFDYRVTADDYKSNVLEMGGLILLTAGATAIQFVPNVVFDWELPLSPSRMMYRAGIMRAFGATPPNCFRDHNACTASERKQGDDGWVRSNLTFDLLRQEYEKGNIPLWIINTTAGEDRVLWRWKQKDYRLTNFQFSPYGSGSYLFGYSKRSLDGLLPWEAVMSSAAFLDSQQRVYSPGWSTLANAGLRIFALDWGLSVRNDRMHLSEYAFHKILPWPLYFLHGRQGNSANSHANIRLSDGGQSENLGAFALIQRNLPNMILSDHSADRSGSMGDVCRLKTGLQSGSANGKELYLFIPGLLDLERVCSAGSFLGYDIFNWQHPILLGCITSDSKNKDCSQVGGVNNDHFQRVFLIKPALSNSNGHHEIGKTLAKRSLEQIMDKCKDGKIDDKRCGQILRKVCHQGSAMLPYVNSKSSQVQNPWSYETRISCELLGFTAINALAELPNNNAGSVKYVINSEGTNKDDACPYFPQSSTIDITTNSSFSLFGAYRELGRYYARQLGWFFGRENTQQWIDDSTLESRYLSVLAYQAKYPISPTTIPMSDAKAGKIGECLL